MNGESIASEILYKAWKKEITSLETDKSVDKEISVDNLLKNISVSLGLFPVIL